MKTYLVKAGGKGWELTERAAPKAGPGEIAIAVRAVSLNFRDLLIAQGKYVLAQKPDLVPCSDGAGEVVAVGPGVTLWKVGDRVMSQFVQGWESGPIRPEAHQSALGGSLDGMLTELVALPERGVVRIPDHLSYEEAATLPCAALTAWNALFESAPAYRPGATVLVQGTGGVAIATVQLARAAGLRVIGTTSTPSKVERLRKLGADAVIDTRATPDWDAQALALTGGEGVDHVVDVVGAQTLDRSINATRFAGTVSVVGLMSGLGPVNSFPLLAKSVRLQGVLVGSRAMAEAMNRTLAAHKIRPVVDQAFRFDEAPAAIERLAAGAHVGKIVVRVG